jgi:hypothetical protein
MKNATYVVQSDTIRTLTEEEMAVVSGGFSGGSWQAVNAQILAAGRQFSSRPASYYISRDPRVNARTFFSILYW